MEEQHIDMDDFEIRDRYQKYLYLSTPLPMKCGHLVPDCYMEQQIKKRKYQKI